MVHVFVDGVTTLELVAVALVVAIVHGQWNTLGIGQHVAVCIKCDGTGGVLATTEGGSCGVDGVTLCVVTAVLVLGITVSGDRRLGVTVVVIVVAVNALVAQTVD